MANIVFIPSIIDVKKKENNIHILSQTWIKLINHPHRHIYSSVNFLLSCQMKIFISKLNPQKRYNAHVRMVLNVFILDKMKGEGNSKAKPNKYAFIFVILIKSLEV